MTTSITYSSLNACLKDMIKSCMEGPIVLVLRATEGKCYSFMRLDCALELLDTYCGFEVIKNNTGRFWIDIDSEVPIDYKPYVRKLVSIFQTEYETSKILFHISGCSDDDKYGMHIVIEGVVFDRCWVGECRKISKMLKEDGLLHDQGVYREHSCKRINGHYKWVEGRMIRKYHNMTKSNRLQTFVSVYSNSEKVIKSRDVPTMTKEMKLYAKSMDPRTLNIELYNIPLLEHIVGADRAKNIHNYICRLRDFLPRSIDSSRRIINMIRVRESYCILCSRMHSRENAYIVLITLKRMIKIGCYRAMNVDGEISYKVVEM